MRPLATRFLQAFPATLDRDAWGSYTAAVNDFRIDNFGSAGTSLLLHALGIEEPDEAFQARAFTSGGMPRLGRLAEELQ